MDYECVDKENPKGWWMQINLGRYVMKLKDKTLKDFRSIRLRKCWEYGGFLQTSPVMDREWGKNLHKGGWEEEPWLVRHDDLKEWAIAIVQELEKGLKKAGKEKNEIESISLMTAYKFAKNMFMENFNLMEEELK